MGPDSGEIPEPGPAGAAGDSYLPVGLTFVIVTAGVVVGAYGLGRYAGIIGPLFFAVTLILTVSPLRNWLVAKRVPRWVASSFVLILLYVVVVGLLLALGMAITQLTQVLPEYSGKFADLYKQALGLLGEYGVNVDDLKRMIGTIDVGRIVSIAQATLASLSSASSQMLLLLIVLAFLVVDTQQVVGRAELLVKHRPHLSAALHDFAVRIRRYWAVNSIFGAIVAAMDVIALAIIGVPLFWVWGIIAFVTNFIPNVGFLLGVIPPALLALLDSGPVEALVVIVVYSAINFIMQSIIQPKFTGDAVGLNTTITFVSLVFWTAVIGPLGALLAVPLTLFFKSLLIDSDPRLQWIAVFLRAKDTEAKEAELERPDSPQAPIKDPETAKRRDIETAAANLDS